MYILDESPKLPDGSRFDGKDLLQLLRSGKSPFHGAWDVNVLKEEVEHNLHAQVIDMPFVSMGSNYYVCPPELPRPSLSANISFIHREFKWSYPMDATSLRASLVMM